MSSAPRGAAPGISYQEALERVLAQARPLPAEEVPFAQALGRVLAQDLVADRDEPPAPKSAMDGYALAARDTQGASPAQPRAFAYSEVVGAGHLAKAPLPPGGAVRIMTGALLPRGADAVAKLEDTQALDPAPGASQRFALPRPLRPGENVIPPGARMARGQTLLGTGSVLDAQELGMLASLGRSRINVYRRPRVALLALGDELVELGQPVGPGQIPLSNLYVLQALAGRYGAEARSLGIARDDPAHIRAALEPCLAPAAPPRCDLLLTLGGSHRGDFDFAHSVLEGLGARLHITRTRMNSGPSTLFATVGETLVFGLPGTPATSWMAFEVLVRPALWRLAGRANLGHPTLQARLLEPLALRPGRTHFLPARLQAGPGEPQVRAIVGTHPLEAPLAPPANALIRCLEGEPAPAPGSLVTVEWLGP